MYKTVSCKYANIALACHLHSYNKKKQRTQSELFYGAFFLSCTKLTTLSCSLRTKCRWSVSVYTPTGATDRGLSQ